TGTKVPCRRRAGGIGITDDPQLLRPSRISLRRRSQSFHLRGEVARSRAMTAAPDWLREVRGEFGVGFDAIALFRGADPDAVSEAIVDCEVLTLAPETALLRPGDPNDTIFVLLSGELAAFLDSAKLPDAATWRYR